MPYLIALALIVSVAIYLCARLFPRTHTNPDARRRARPHEQRAQEGDPS